MDAQPADEHTQAVQYRCSVCGAIDFDSPDEIHQLDCGTSAGDSTLDPEPANG